VTITAKPGVKLEIPDGKVIENKVSFPKIHTLTGLSRILQFKKKNQSSSVLIFLREVCGNFEVKRLH
jgi:hypothetical protein